MIFNIWMTGYLIILDMTNYQERHITDYYYLIINIYIYIFL